MTIEHLCYCMVTTLQGMRRAPDRCSMAVALHGSYMTVCSIHVLAARRPRVCEPRLVVAVLEDLLTHLLSTTRVKLRDARTLRKTRVKLRRTWISL